MFSKVPPSHYHHTSSPPKTFQDLLLRKHSLDDPNPSPSSTLPHTQASNSRKGKYTGCNCSKSQCLKMYCVCFSAGRMCDETCLCQQCKNSGDNMERSEAISQIIDKDPLAFSRSSGKQAEQKTCNCRKSFCQKKYCQCFKAGRMCSEKCECLGCKNKEDLKQSLAGKSVKLLKLI